MIWPVVASLLFLRTSMASFIGPGSGISCLFGCSKPPTFEDKVLTFKEKGAGGESFCVGDTLTYRCRPSYGKESGTSVARCGRHGKWNGPTLQCKLVDESRAIPFIGSERVNRRGDCFDPPHPEGRESIVTRPPYWSGAEVNYTCGEKYEYVSGAKVYRCTYTGQWTQTHGNLVCQEIRCKRPAKINNGQIIPVDHASFGLGEIIPVDHASFGLGESITYTCSEGYILAGGDRNRTCMNRRIWSGWPPFCRVLKCSPPKSIDHGFLIDSRHKYMVDEKATYKCNNGYTLNGYAQLTCLKNERWSREPPVCSLVDCGVPVKISGTLTLEQGVTTYLSQIKIRCYAGPNFTFSSFCNSKGLWAPPLTCPKNCSKPDIGLHSAVQGWPRYTQEGEYAPVYCANGDRMICRNGSWNPSISDCFKNRCTMPVSENLNVLPSYKLFDHHGIIKVACRNGFVLNGSPSIQCDEGTWKPQIPSCSPKETMQIMQVQAASGIQIKSPLPGELLIQILTTLLMCHYDYL